MQNFTGLFKALRWSIQLSKNWESEVNEECYTFFHPEGYGALQISDYTKDTPITDEDIIDLVEFNEEEKLHLRKVKFGDFEGLHLVYSDEKNTFWRKWWVKNDQLLLFITYNCDVKDKEYNVNTINKMLSSLRVLNDEHAKS
jgi:hypothetical protein